MNSRISLLKFNTSMEMQEIANSLTTKRYVPDSNSGFMLTKASSTSLHAKHITKVVVRREVLTPFGDKEIEETVDYLINEFEVTKDLLRLKNSTRSLSVFRSDFWKALGFDCTIATPTLDLKSVAEEATSSSQNLNIINIEAVSHKIFANTVVKFSLSGKVGLMEKLKEISLKECCTIKKITISFSDNDYLEVSQKGNLKVNVSAENAALATKFIRNHIETSFM